MHTIPLYDEKTVSRIGSPADPQALNMYRVSPAIAEIAALREKYDLHMKAVRLTGDEFRPDEKGFIRE